MGTAGEGNPRPGVEAWGIDLTVASLDAVILLDHLGVRCPTCPMCGRVPAPGLSVLWPGQAMCESDDCPVLMWNPLVPATTNLKDPGVVDLEGQGR